MKTGDGLMFFNLKLSPVILRHAGCLCTDLSRGPKPQGREEVTAFGPCALLKEGVLYIFLDDAYQFVFGNTRMLAGHADGGTLEHELAQG